MNSTDFSACLNDIQLARVLAPDALTAELNAAADHVENCPHCQRRLEAAAGLSQVQPEPAQSAAADSGSGALRTALDSLRQFSPGSAGLPPVGRSDTLVLGTAVKPGSIGRFGGLDILERIASGGMGIVFKGHDPILNRIVAVKVLSPALAASESARVRFLREARAAAAVVHENVVAIYAVGEEKGLPYLVMQFVQGDPLQARLAAGPMRLDQILRIGIQVSRGLEAAHAQGLIHRDIKSGNILLENPGERVKLTDFGLARAVDEPGLTRPGTVAGTPEYMAPEQTRGGRIDARADLFSLGVVLYALSTGRSPFLAESTYATLRNVCDLVPPPPHEVHPAVPSWLSDIIMRLLAKNPPDRFPSAEKLAGLLESHLATVQSGTALSKSKVLSPKRASACRARWMAAAAASFLFILAPAGGWRASPKQALPPSSGGSFVLLRKDGTVRGLFQSLSAAVEVSAGGDTIEIAGVGSVLCEPVNIRGKPLRLRAATNGAPALINPHRTAPLITTDSSLVVEGLELRSPGGDSDMAPWPFPGKKGWSNTQPLPVGTNSVSALRNELVWARGAAVTLRNCRLVGPSVAVPGQECIRADQVPRLVVQNCELYHYPGPIVVWKRSSGAPATASAGSLRLENCTFFGREVLSLEVGSDDATQIECVRNTFVGVQAFSATGSGQVTVDARQNVFDVNLVAQRRNGDSNFPPDRTWHGVSNLYSLVHPARSPGLRNHSPAPDLARLIATVDTNSAMGDARIRSRLMERNRLPGRISALEFCPAPAVTNTTPKLAPETLWRVGADVALVGPGPAYRKWRAGPSHEGLLVPARLSTH